MYELHSAITAAPSLRAVRERSLPSLQRRSVQERELDLSRTMQRSAAPAAASAEGFGLAARAGSLLTGWMGRDGRRPGHTTAA